MKEITFNDLPEAMAGLLEKLSRIEERINEGVITSTPRDNSDCWFTVGELCQYLPSHPKEQTIYNKVSKNCIPFYKSGRSLLFRKSEIDAWLMSDKHKTQAELKAEAAKYAKIRRSA